VPVGKEKKKEFFPCQPAKRSAYYQCKASDNREPNQERENEG